MTEIIRPRVSVHNALIEDWTMVFEKIGAEPVSWPKMAQKATFITFHIRGLSNKAATILKQEALSKDGEAVVSRRTLQDLSATTDVLLALTERQLHILLRDLKDQPFGLAKLATEIETTWARYGQGPAPITVRKLQLDWSGTPLVMGILNVTLDSFSDGGKYGTFEAAITHADIMVSEGVPIIDVGGESTRPGSEPVPEEEQLRRVIPVIEALRQKHPTLIISIDTTRAAVAQAALKAGADIINDVSAGSDDDQILSVAAKAGTPYVLMHRSAPVSVMQEHTDYDDVVTDIYDWFVTHIECCEDAGINRSQIIIDPGIGFGKTANQNLTLLNRLHVFRGLGLPILVGSSRKRFIGDTLNRGVDDREFGTAATLAICTLHGANIVRVHSVSQMQDVVSMTQAIRRKSHDA